MGLTGCSVHQDATVSTVNEECRDLGYLANVPAPIKPGEVQTVFATINDDESFAYPVKQTVLPSQP